MSLNFFSPMEAALHGTLPKPTSPQINCVPLKPCNFFTYLEDFLQVGYRRCVQQEKNFRKGVLKKKVFLTCKRTSALAEVLFLFKTQALQRKSFLLELQALEDFFAQF
jgi:hypothetical protein